MTINQNMTDNPHYVTPEEADLKLCPMAKQHQNAEWEYYCDGPKCMAWRWKPTHRQAEWPTPQIVTEYNTTHGYCGMVRD